MTQYRSAAEARRDRARRAKKEAALLYKWVGVPLGTPVTVTRDNGDKLESVTRSGPWLICGTACIMVDGISGGYALDRVELRPPTPDRGERG